MKKQYMVLSATVYSQCIEDGRVVTKCSSDHTKCYYFDDKLSAENFVVQEKLLGHYTLLQQGDYDVHS